jgi:hypothetical protein
VYQKYFLIHKKVQTKILPLFPSLAPSIRNGLASNKRGLRP